MFCGNNWNMKGMVPILEYYRLKSYILMNMYM